MRRSKGSGPQLPRLAHSIAGAVLLALATAAGCWLDARSAAAGSGCIGGQQLAD